MKRTRLFAAALALLLLTGCGASAKMETSASAPAAPAPMPEAAMPMEKFESASDAVMELPMAPEYSMSGTTAGGAGESIYQRADAKLIRRCNVELQSEEFDAAVSALYALVESNGGYFENSSVRGGGYYNANARRTGEYVIRVPAENYNAFRSGVGELGYVNYSNESTEDIGEQYYDTEARVKTLRTKQERLLMLLEKAENMEDIIELESALGDVEYEIERYSSTLNRYDGLVNFATFTVSISEVVRVEEQVGQADSLGDRMSAGFRYGVENLKDSAEDFMVWISYNVFVLAAWVVIGGVIVAIIRRKKPGFPKLRRKKGLPEDKG